MKPSDLIARPCPVPETLPDSDDFEIHCDHCDKTVTNMSYLTPEEEAEWREKNAGGCIRIREELGVVQFYKPKKAGRLFTAMTVVLLSSAAGYAELGSFFVSHEFQSASSLNTKASLAAEMMARRAEQLGDLFDALKPKPKLERKFSQGANEEVTRAVTF